MSPLRAPMILIVDDESANRRLLAVLLRPEGYRTESVASGAAALAAIALRAPDLVLLDIMMPGIDGYQVAGILKASPATANIPIIMVTARSERSARLAGLEAGAEEFLTKPVDRSELWLRVRNLLRLKTFGDMQQHSLGLEALVAARTADLQRFRTAMDVTADAILLISRASMRFIEFNATSCRMLGYTRAELFALEPAALGAATQAELERIYDTLIVGQSDIVRCEASLRRKDGTAVQVEIHRQAVRSDSGWMIVSVVRDISERMEAGRRLQHQAHHDALTGLPNRTLFFDTLERTLEQADQQGWQVALMFIDLDHFKNVNDTLGHASGDALLVQFSVRLLRCVRVRDTVARLGGDEFALIIVMQEGHQVAAQVASKIREALRAPYDLLGHDVVITASIGITIYPDDARAPDNLLRYADTAMYEAKHAGRDTFRFFTAQMNADALQRLELECALRKALQNEEFVLHYQPKVELLGGHVVGFEALLRWQRPGHGLVAPGMFMAVLEETGLIVPVGQWVIASACAQIQAWRSQGLGEVRVSVNVAGRQFVEGDLADSVFRALAQFQVPPGLLELELTETSLMVKTEHTIGCLQRLRAQGVSISIDDFGTGYSSLAYLQRFPVDKLKIDIAFIRDVITNPDAAAIVRAIISMAHSLHLQVIAEGVESAAQVSHLRRQDCDQIQGYVFSRPLSVAQTSALLAQRRRLPLVTPYGSAGPTLLVVDDERGTRALLQLLFESQGYRVLLAASAAEGFTLLAQHAVQVILCDQCMPEMDGIEFCQRVQRLYPRTFRMLLTGFAEQELSMEAINSGAISRYFVKPWSNRLLLDNVRMAFLQAYPSSTTQVYHE